METQTLLIHALLYLFLPLWGIAGFADWCCHRATRIETTSGLKESLMHSLMGLQVGIPILLCLLFRINVLVLLICLLAWVLHELVAHWDVHYTAPRRRIGIWEMHAHSYLASLPLYMLAMILILNWPVVLDLVRLEWAGQLRLERLAEPHGGERYLPLYLTFMAVLCVFPYLEENLRCLRHSLSERSDRA
ncbi:diguanylate cyclase [Halomonas campisalis]|uniref:Diguanylate cyclase n=1 Tax=Billgrantia campisalis TaxID=74661 RepID=A0ABS9P9L0_9GAMM|nr:diguanylate cyclase [Halomonas campisalis]MCG6658461.1 diguanylate cyclase [Halomonas campisalis]MDR5863321.1 diguanylate cyclase [Halomonas campisalis]